MHVGMHKTGSTSIQASLRQLDDGQFYYARLGNGGNHSVPFAMMFATDVERFRFYRKREFTAADVAQAAEIDRASLLASIEAAEDRTLIVSGEGICLLTAAELEEVRKFFAAASCAVEIVAYVRPPGEFMSSFMQQRLSDLVNGAADISVFYPNYRQRLSKFDDIFEARNVRFFKFEPGAFPDRDVVSDFCSRVGIAMDGIESVRKNPSRPKAQLRLNYQYKKAQQALGLPPIKLRGHEGWEFLADLDRSRFRISPDLVRPVLAANAGDIAWMENRLGQSLAEDLGEEAADDYRSEADLLAPVPGAREKLIEKIREQGGGEQGDDRLDVLALLARWAALVESTTRPNAVRRGKRLRKFDLRSD